MSKMIWFAASISVPGVEENLFIKIQVPEDVGPHLVAAHGKRDFVLQVRDLRLTSPGGSPFDHLPQDELPCSD